MAAGPKAPAPVMGPPKFTSVDVEAFSKNLARMIEGGARPANLAEPLVRYRVGAGAYARRGGTGLLRSELALQRRFRDLGITTRSQYARNVLVRGGYRLVPEPVRRTAYRALIANRGATSRADGGEASP